MPLDLQYDIINDTPAAAGPVEANFTRTEQYINNELIARDGHVAMTGQLRLVGSPVNDLDAASKNYVDQVLPIGIVMMFGGAGVPPGGRWLLCDGTEYQTADWPELFEAIGSAYGGSAGRFNVPNLGGRVGLGADVAHPTATTGGSADSVGLPAHTHTIDHTHAPVSTAVASADHVHGVNDHQHSMAHTHAIDNHRHWILPTPGSSVVRSETAGGASLIPLGAGGNTMDFANTTGDQQAVTNTVTQSPSNTAGLVAATWTTGMDTNHSHNVQVPALAGASGVTGSGVANGNLPPYLAIEFVIRAK